MTKILNLSQGKTAIVDDEDYEWLNQWKWYARKGGGTYYAQRTDYSFGKKLIQMHRFILNAPDELAVDHINRDGLCNTKANLRLATRSENKANTPAYSNNHSGFKGVVRERNKWRAMIRVNGKLFHLGMFSDILQAAQAYDRASLQFYGEFARTNLPQESIVESLR